MGLPIVSKYQFTLEKHFSNCNIKTLNFEILINCNIINSKNCSILGTCHCFIKIYFILIINVKIVQSHEFISIQILGNELLMNNNKCVFFNNWIDCKFINTKNLLITNLKDAIIGLLNIESSKRIVLKLVNKHNFNTHLVFLIFEY